jgi:hypothetical protein
MPEFHNLQCYTVLDSRSLRGAIARFGAVLHACGIRDPQFDLAWIPESNAPLFPPRDAYLQHSVPGGVGVARKAAWSEPPWRAPSPPIER